MINKEKLSKQIKALLEEHKTASIQVAMIKDGEVILNEGYGYRDFENKIETNEDTVYAIGSSTKAFTGAAIAKLVEEGKLEWDKPVKLYIPELEMNDKYVTEELSVRDILCHRCGLPRHDLVWFLNEYSSEELIAKLKYLKPSAPFRHTLQYQNAMFALAGYLIERITGKRWYEYIDDVIIKPTGMENTYFSTEDAQEVDNKALPYDSSSGEITDIPYYYFPKNSTIGAAGSMYSNAKNVLKWVDLNLNKGKFDGKQIIDEKEILECQTPQMINRTMFKTGFEEIDMQSYGFGWFIESFKGHKIVHHGGNINGYSAMVAFIPSINAGFSFLTNTNGSDLQTILLYAFIDLLLGNDNIESWNKKSIEFINKAKEEGKKMQQAFIDSCAKNTNKSFELEAYVGKFVNEAYGEIEIMLDDSQIKLKNTLGTFLMKHLCVNTFIVDGKVGGMDIFMPVEFKINMTGQITGMMVVLEPAIKEGIEFKKEDK